MKPGSLGDNSSKDIVLEKQEALDLLKNWVDLNNGRVQGGILKCCVPAGGWPCQGCTLQTMPLNLSRLPIYPTSIHSISTGWSISSPSLLGSALLKLPLPQII